MLLEEVVEFEQELILHGVIMFLLMGKQEMWNVNSVRKYYQ